MLSVLIYTKDNHTMSKIMADQLDQLGFQTEQTSVINLPRLILNSYHVIHFIVSTLPLSLNELICMSAAKALGKAVVLSVLEMPDVQSSQSLNWVHPDAITVSQTNYLKFFRHKTGTKMIIPTLFENLIEKAHKPARVAGYVFPLLEKIDEGIHFHSEKPIFFDGRKLLNKYTSSQLRKQWTELLIQKKIKSHYQLILSNEKMQSLITDQTLALVLASPNMKHSDFSIWLKLALKHNHLLVLNQFQATGFSNHWTSGHNCFVTTTADWINELNTKYQDPVFSKEFTTTDLNQKTLDSLFNDLSRLYTKIIYQKASLIDSGSAKI